MAALLPGFANQAEKLSIIPRTGGALGFTYIPPKTEDRWAAGYQRQPGRRKRAGQCLQAAADYWTPQPAVLLTSAAFNNRHRRALMFDREIRGQLAMLMGGRAAEEVSCDAGARCAALCCWCCAVLG